MTQNELEQYKKDHPENVSYSATPTNKEDISILFSGKEMDKILELQKELGLETVQETIMNTIELATKWALFTA